MSEPLIEHIIDDASRVTINQDSSYLRSYPEFLRYFRDIPVIERHHLIIAANFTYGWMPTILRFKSDQFDRASAILNQAKTGDLLTDDDLWCLIGVINNSMVGVSKLLHFINPERYAIWDRRVASYMQRTCQWSGAYLAYLTLCRTLVSDARFLPVHTLMSTKVNYPISALRAVELIMYETEVQRGRSPHDGGVFVE